MPCQTQLCPTSHRLLNLRLAALALLMVTATLGPVRAADNDRGAIAAGYQSAVNEKRWPDAVEQAQRMVAIERAAPGRKSLALADALQKLGLAQRGVEDTQGAEASYAEALNIIEPLVGNTDRRIIGPLRGLGSTLAQMQRHKEAAAILERAVLISHRSDGLFNPEQENLLLQLSASYYVLGERNEAHQKLLYLYQVCEHTYGVASPEMMRALAPLADFYSNVGDFERSRSLYAQGIALVERKLGSGDPALAPLLRGYARSYVRELFILPLVAKPPPLPSVSGSLAGDFEPIEVQQLASRKNLPKQGQQALERAVRILDAQPLLAKRDEYLQTLLDMGDWLLIKGDTQAALPYYRKASTLRFTGRQEEHSQPLSYPVPVYYLPPVSTARYADRSEEEIVRRSVLVEFTVTAEGAVKQPTVITADASPRQIGATLEALNNARYRPRLENDAPVDTPGVRYRETFRELRKDKSSDADSGATASDSKASQ